MQLIDFRGATCEVYIGTYIGADCDNPTTEPKRTVIKYVNVGGVISAYIVKNISWDDREIATYNPHNISDSDIPATLLSKLLECNVAVNTHDSEITCVEENDLLYIIQFSQTNNTYIVLDFQGNDVTGTVTPIKCSSSEKYDIVNGGDYCDNGANLTRFDVFNLETQLVENSYFTNEFGTIVIANNPIKGKCEINLVPGATDIVTNTGDSLDIYMGQFVKSFTLVAEVDTIIFVNGNTKTLKAGVPYTWSQGEKYNIDVTSIIFTTTGNNIEAIWEV